VKVSDRVGRIKHSIRIDVVQIDLHLVLKGRISLGSVVVDVHDVAGAVGSEDSQQAQREPLLQTRPPLTFSEALSP